MSDPNARGGADIVERLRERARGPATDRTHGLMAEAAAEIERMRGALRVIAAQDSGVPTSTSLADCMAALARAALEPRP